MEITLQDSNVKSINKDIDFAYHKENLVYNHENIKVLEPILIKGNVFVKNGIADVKLSVKTKVEYTCSRCLDPYEEELDLTIEERISKNEQEDESIIALEEGDVLDITDVVLNSIYLALPLKNLCREDCKGLCQNCGTNLNHDQCDCVIDDIDPRLSALKDIFKEV